jgi:hypothetical protein
VDSRVQAESDFQKAIFPAIERYLAGHPEVLQPVAPSQAVRLPSDQIFVGASLLVEMGRGMAKGLRRLARKYDPAVRDEHNRSLGRAGEEFVVDVERDRLIAAECSDLAGGFDGWRRRMGMGLATTSYRLSQAGRSDCWRQIRLTGLPGRHFFLPGMNILSRPRGRKSGVSIGSIFSRQRSESSLLRRLLSNRLA